MNFLAVIDHLGLGGAQHQFVCFCITLASKGHRVRVWMQYPELNNRQLEGLLIVNEVEIVTDLNANSLYGAQICKLRVELSKLVDTHLLAWLDRPIFLAFLANLNCTDSVITKSCFFRNAKTWPLARLIAGRYDYVFCNSRYGDLFRSKRLGPKLHYLPNGVVPWRTMENSQKISCQSPNFVVGVGRISSQKSPHLLALAALRVAKKSRKKIRVKWYGQMDLHAHGCMEKELVESVCSTSQQLLSWEWVSGETSLGELFKEGHLCMCSRYEGFSNILMEAAGAKIPVLNFCKEMEFSDAYNVFNVEKPSVFDFGDLIYSFIEHPQFFIDKVKSNVDKNVALSMDRVVDEYIEIIQA